MATTKPETVTEKPYTAGYLRGLLPSEVTIEIIYQRMQDPEYNPLAGIEPEDRTGGANA